MEEKKSIFRFFKRKPKPKKTFLQNLYEIVVLLSVIFVLRTYVFGLYHVPSGSAEPNLLVGDRVLGNKLIYRLFRDPQRHDFVMFDEAEFVFDRSNTLNYYWQKYLGFFSVPLLGLTPGPINVVKRIIGIPGDKIEGRVEDGKATIYLNDKKLDEPYMNPFPLIRLHKKVGFFNIDRIGPLRFPWWLRKRIVPVRYTYDPSKSFHDQPYYNMSEEEVVLDYTFQPILDMPKSPTLNEYGKVVDNFGPFIIPKGKYWVMGDSRKNSKDSRFWGFLDEELIQGKASLILFSIDSEEPMWFFELFKKPITLFTKLVRWGRSFKFL